MRRARLKESLQYPPKPSTLTDGSSSLFRKDDTVIQHGFDVDLRKNRKVEDSERKEVN